MLRKDGQPFQFKLETNSGNKVREADTVVAQAQFNPDVDQLLQQAATLPGCGQQDRQQLYARFQEILAQEQPVTQLYSRKTTLAISKRIQGFDPSPWASDEFGIQNWVVAPR